MRASEHPQKDLKKQQTRGLAQGVRPARGERSAGILPVAHHGQDGRATRAHGPTVNSGGELTVTTTLRYHAARGSQYCLTWVTFPSWKSTTQR